MSTQQGETTIKFHLLGPVEALVDTQRRALNGRQRSLLAALLLNANRLVSTDRLAASLWAEPLPAKVTVRVRTLVSELRRALTGADPILTRAPGYQIRVEAGQLDLDSFGRLVEQAREHATHGRLELAVGCYDEAIALWRGTALDGATGPFVAAEVARLAELRLGAVEERVTAMLALGRHAALVPELSALVAEHPTRERPHGQLMAALGGCGRRGDALEVFRRLRERLVDELGLEPAAELQQLHRQLLAGEPATAAPTAALTASANASANASRTASPAAARTNSAAASPAPSPGGSAAVTNSAAVRPAAPAAFRQLPPPPGRMVGRHRPLAALDELAAGPPRLGLVVGPAGVGKTTLVLHWAHRCAERFPDGQLYLDMRGFDRRARLTPDEALPQLLRALGLAAEEIPLDIAEQLPLYRSATAGRRMLLVLDNVAESDQVRPLLPSGTGCLTVLTSRDRLSGLVALDGARRLTLAVLSPDEAVEVLTEPNGGAGDDPGAAAELAQLCGYLPLALRIAGARLADQPHRGIRQQVDELANHGRLAGLRIEGDGRANVRGAFELSYQTLPPPVQRMFRLLGLVPTPAGLSPAGAAALAGVQPAQAISLLGTLVRIHLVTQTTTGRYGCHDLLLDYSAELAGTDEPADRAAAVRRLLDFYLYATDNSTTTIFGPVGRMLPRAPIPAGISVPTFTDVAAAREWMTGEWDNVLAAFGHAATHGPDPLAWYLADALRPVMRLGASLPELAAVGRTALAAAQRAGDPLGEGAMHYLVGLQHFRAADFRATVEAGEQALRCYRQADWPSGEATALSAMGGSFVHLGAVRLGIDRLTESLEIMHRIGDHKSAATILVNLAGAHLEGGNFAESQRYAALARPALAESGNRHAEAIMLTNLGLLQHAQGRLAEALVTLEEAHALALALGSRHHETSVQISLGTVHFDAGRYAQAAKLLCEAVERAAEIGDGRLEIYAANGLAREELRSGLAGEAVVRLEKALGRLDRAGHQQGRIEALLTLSQAHAAQRQHRTGYQCAEEALTFALECEYVALAGRAHSALAACHLGLGDLAGCRREAARALHIQRRSEQRLAEARTLVTLGDAQWQAGRPAAAHAHWRRADALFEETGAADRANPSRLGA